MKRGEKNEQDSKHRRESMYKGNINIKIRKVKQQPGGVQEKSRMDRWCAERK